MHEWTPQSLHNVSHAYWASCALHTAVVLDVFSPLYHSDGVPLDVADLATAIGCDVRGTELLVTALCGMGLLQRTRQGVQATPFARQYLCGQSPDCMGPIIRHQGNLMEGWFRLDEAVRHGRPCRTGAAHSNDAQERENFLMGMYNVANLQASRIVPHIDLSGRGHLLDLGGGPGTYAMHFCRYNPELHATVFDLPTSEPFARKVIDQNKLAARIDFVGGNFLRDPLPAACDVVWISQILHAFTAQDCAELVRRAVESAAPGACLFIQDFLVDDDRNGPEFPGLFGLNMLTGTEGGQTYTAQDIADMFSAAGAVAIARIPLELPQNCGIIRAEKPL